MVRRAAGFLVRNGPVTQQDRWEEDAGYSPFTLAVEISALLAAADFADASGEPRVAAYLRETADAWNASIERWTYVSGTDLARNVGVDGLLRAHRRPGRRTRPRRRPGSSPIKNRPPATAPHPAAEIVSPDALALVRFGLRAADDPRILNTVRVIDALLKVETPYGPVLAPLQRRRLRRARRRVAPSTGPAWAGPGRSSPASARTTSWPPAVARKPCGCCERMGDFANDGGLIPEQVWDVDDIPERELFFGRPSGSAMPLAWAHAEYLKLRRSLGDGRVFDQPSHSYARYVEAQTPARYVTWRFNNKRTGIQVGDRLRVESPAPARVQWTTDAAADGRTSEVATDDTGLGMFVVDLPTAEMSAGTTVRFTFYWPAEDRWEGTDFEVVVGADA